MSMSVMRSAASTPQQAHAFKLDKLVHSSKNWFPFILAEAEQDIQRETTQSANDKMLAVTKG